MIEYHNLRLFEFLRNYRICAHLLPRQFLVFGLVLIAVTSGGLLQSQKAFDTAYFIDVSAYEEDVFNEIKRTLMSDVSSRNLGDTIALYTYDVGVPKLRIEQLIQTEAERQRVIAEIRKINRSKIAGHLHFAILESVAWGRKWAKVHPENIVDIRLYTDGEDKSPISRQQVLDALGKLDHGEHENLFFYLALYEKDGMDADWLKDSGFKRTPANPVFVRVQSEVAQMGNMRATFPGIQHPVSLFYPSQVKGRDVYSEPTYSVLDPESGNAPNFRPHINVRPRPFSVSDEIILLTIEWAGLENSQENADYVISGGIAFSSSSSSEDPREGKTDSSVPIQFHPELIPIKGRIAPLRELRLNPKNIHSLALLPDGTIQAKLTEKTFCVADPRDPGFHPWRFLFEVVEKRRWVDGDKIDLSISAAGVEYSALKLMKFLETGGVAEWNPTTVSVTGNTSAISCEFSLLDNQLEELAKPGNYSAEIQLSSDNPDIQMMLPVSIDGSAKWVPVKSIKVQLADELIPLQNSFWRRLIVSIIEALIIALLARLLLCLFIEAQIYLFLAGVIFLWFNGSWTPLPIIGFWLVPNSGFGFGWYLVLLSIPFLVFLPNPGICIGRQIRVDNKSILRSALKRRRHYSILKHKLSGLTLVAGQHGGRRKKKAVDIPVRGCDYKVKLKLPFFGCAPFKLTYVDKDLRVSVGSKTHKLSPVDPSLKVKNMATVMDATGNITFRK